jgi:ABC-type antimicrobial peptide transport system permease subunit
MALGAKPGNVLRMILANGISLAASGVAIGIVVALAAAPLLRSLLHDVSPRDPLIHFVDGLANPIRIPQLTMGGGPSVCGRHASFDLAVRFYLEVRLEFGSTLRVQSKPGSLN